MNTKTKQRLISIVLCVAMLISLMPTAAFAAPTLSGNGGDAWKRVTRRIRWRENSEAAMC